MIFVPPMTKALATQTQVTTLTPPMKRRRPLSSPLSSIKTSCSTPPSTPTKFLKPTKSPPLSLSTTPPPSAKRSLSKTLNFQNWIPLNLPKSELSLPLTFPTGQTFRWKQTGHLQYTGVLGSHLVSLKHLQNGDVAYHFHTYTHDDDAELGLLDFLNMGISLTDMWEGFAAADTRFAELATRLQGVRVLRQDPLECLIQFLCSSNNNISRITKMVDYISSLGDFLGSVEGFRFYRFPTLERLAMVSEQELRGAGFGYRAKYTVNTVKALQLKPGGGSEWLSSLRELELDEVMKALLTLPGVGPKVAACVALFSLDQHHAVPVDTHVWQIAARDLMPELAGVRQTQKLCSRVADAFVIRYGKYAGWAQTMLFVAELPSQKAIVSSQLCTVKVKNLPH